MSEWTVRLVPPEITIGLDEGFNPEKDIFERRSFGDRLTRIVRELEGPAVIMLDAPWGMGKTTFVRMWRGALLKENIQSVYFDAFANDYHEDAFLALAGEIIAKTVAATPPAKKALKKFKTTAVGVAKVLGRAALTVGVNVGTAGLIDAGAIASELGSGIAQAAKDVGSDSSKIVDELIKERLESHNADREAFSAFQAALGELVSAYSDTSENPANEGKKALPIIFFIDELDRCRPTFAVALLEKVKHFFSVPGLVFVLVTNLSQLEASVRFAYGNIEAEKYLEKFYHLRMTLPSITKPTPDSDMAGLYVRHLFSRVLPQDEPNLMNNLREIVSQFGRVHSLSLRTLERVCAHTAIFLISTEKNYLRPAPIIAGLSVMKAVTPKLYEKARAGRLQYSEVETFFQFDEWTDWHDKKRRSNAGEFTEKWWRYVLGAADEETTNRFNRGLIQYNFGDQLQILRWCCDFIDGVTLPQA